MIKAILLDVDNTLLDFDKSATEVIKKLFSKMGLTYTDNVFRTFIRINDGLWKKIEKAEITREQLHNIRWDTVFSELGITADGKRAEKLFLDGLHSVAIPVDGAKEILGYLSAKYALYTASNAPYAQQVNRLTISGLYPFITGIMNFEKDGVHKPQREFFERCMNTLSPLKREEIALIGDSISADVKGGKEMGFTTVWFNAKGVTADEQTRKICDGIITSLSEIKEIF